MDTLLLPGQNPRAWAETMINLEARKLVNTANTVAAMHLQDGFIRIQFVDEIRAFIMAQFEAARRAKTDDDCMACLQALRAENTSLLEQSRSLKTGYAKLYAEVKVVRDENKIVGYIISAVDVVVAGAAIFGGIVMMSSMTPVGVVAGAVIVVNGLTRFHGKPRIISSVINRRREYSLTDRWSSLNFWASAGSRGWGRIKLSHSSAKSTARMA